MTILRLMVRARKMSLFGQDEAAMSTVEGSLDRTTQAAGQHCRGDFCEGFVARTRLRWALEDKDR